VVRAAAVDRRALLRDRGRRPEEDHVGLDHAIDLREQVLNFPSQPVITKDNVTIDIDAVLYYRVADPQKATTPCRTCRTRWRP
jgi:regulator of protease activity HflC (stomatin/prohibitin superfamily)